MARCILLLSILLSQTLHADSYVSRRSLEPAAAYTPPICSAPGPFLDVPHTSPFCSWIKQFVTDGLTVGCGGGNFCPGSPVTREQMAVFVELAMRGTATWSPSQGVFRRTILVSPVEGGTTVQNGSVLLAAMAAVGPLANVNNRYLIKIEPGVYNIETTLLSTVAFVDIEGSGQNVTVIEGYGGNSSVLDDTATVLVAQNSSLSNLSVTSSGSSGSFAHAVVVRGAGATVDHVTATASLATAINTAFAISLSGPILSHVTAIADGGANTYGIRASVGDMTISDALVKASNGTSATYGVSVSNSTIRVLRSRIIVTNSTAGQVYGINFSFGTGVQSVRDSTIDVSTSGTGNNHTIAASNSDVHVHGSSLTLSGGTTLGVNVTTTGAARRIHVENSVLTSATPLTSYVATATDADTSIVIAASRIVGLTTGACTCRFTWNEAGAEHTNCPVL